MDKNWKSYACFVVGFFGLLVFLGAFAFSDVYVNIAKEKTKQLELEVRKLELLKETMKKESVK